MKVVVSPEAERYVRAHGGVLYVRSSHHGCCGGGLTLLDSTTEPPVDAPDYLGVGAPGRVGAKGIEVRVRGRAGDLPHELVIELRGRLKRRPVAYWDGCAFKL
ncbi:MAG TPA: hypothetical protein VN799_09190 [Acidimicrobiales bacterium]|nr:hypothetical protein [Acidimicrobiales bacterium]